MKRGAYNVDPNRRRIQSKLRTEGQMNDMRRFILEFFFNNVELKQDRKFDISHRDLVDYARTNYSGHCTEDIEQSICGLVRGYYLRVSEAHYTIDGPIHYAIGDNAYREGR